MMSCPKKICGVTWRSLACNSKLSCSNPIFLQFDSYFVSFFFVFCQTLEFIAGMNEDDKVLIFVGKKVK